MERLLVGSCLGELTLYDLNGIIVMMHEVKMINNRRKYDYFAY